MMVFLKESAGDKSMKKYPAYEELNLNMYIHVHPRKSRINCERLKACDFVGLPVCRRCIGQIYTIR